MHEFLDLPGAFHGGGTRKNLGFNHILILCHNATFKGRGRRKNCLDGSHWFRNDYFQSSLRESSNCWAAFIRLIKNIDRTSYVAL